MPDVFLEDNLYVAWVEALPIVVPATVFAVWLGIPEKVKVMSRTSAFFNEAVVIDFPVISDCEHSENNHAEASSEAAAEIRRSTLSQVTDNPISIQAEGAESEELDQFEFPSDYSPGGRAVPLVKLMKPVTNSVEKGAASEMSDHVLSLDVSSSRQRTDSMWSEVDDTDQQDHLRVMGATLQAHFEDGDILEELRPSPFAIAAALEWCKLVIPLSKKDLSQFKEQVKRAEEMQMSAESHWNEMFVKAEVEATQNELLMHMMDACSDFEDHLADLDKMCSYLR